MEIVNNAFFSGKIMSKFMTPRGELKLKLSIAKSKLNKETGERVLKKDKDGNYIRSVITIRFFGEMAKRIDHAYQVGDYVNVIALAQTVRNHYSCTSKVEMWGLSVNTKKGARISPLKDINIIELQGKVTDIYTTKTGNKHLTIYTSVAKPVLTASLKPVEQVFASYTTVDVNRGFVCKKGDYVRIKGFVKEEESYEGPLKSVEQFIYTTQAEVINGSGSEVSNE